MARRCHLRQDAKRYKNKSKKRYWKWVFNQVADACEEYASVTGATRMRSDLTDRSITRPCAGVVMPSRADYICEVAICSKRVLSKREYMFWSLLYQDEQGYGEKLKVIKRSPAFKAFLHDLQARLGRAFLSRGLFPIGGYFKPSDTRPCGAGRIKLAPLPLKQAEKDADCIMCSDRDVAEVPEETLIPEMAAAD